MKKLILLLGILCMGFECDDQSRPIENHGAWVVKNTTTQTLIIKPGKQTIQPYNLAPGGKVELCTDTYEISKMPVFQSLLKHRAWSGYAEGNISFEVLSDDGTPLKRWDYTDRDSPGKQFFNESFWTDSQSPGERVDEIKVTWVFELGQNDIQ